MKSVALVLLMAAGCAGKCVTWQPEDGGIGKSEPCPQIPRWVQTYPKWQRVYWTSVAAYAAGASMDAASSYGKLELNPALAGGTHRFDAGSVGIKAGIFGGSVAAEYLVMRRLSAHNPRAAAQAMKIFSLINFGSGAVSGGVAVRNWRIK